MVVVMVVVLVLVLLALVIIIINFALDLICWTISIIDNI